MAFGAAGEGVCAGGFSFCGAGFTSLCGLGSGFSTLSTFLGFSTFFVFCSFSSACLICAGVGAGAVVGVVFRLGRPGSLKLEPGDSDFSGAGVGTVFAGGLVSVLRGRGLVSLIWMAGAGFLLIAARSLKLS